MRGLRKSFQVPSRGTLEVLREVSFAAAIGEMVAITGASGAGKSTLLHLLGGLEAADCGEIKLGEFDLTRARGAELARYRMEDVGFVFQFHHLLPDLSAVENVQLPLLINRRPRAESRRRAIEALDRLGLSQRAAHNVGQLSGGEQQRVAVARALIHRPRLVLADEPTGNLDADIGDEIGALLSDYCRLEQATVVVATHNERLARSSSRTLLLEAGRLCNPRGG